MKRFWGLTSVLLLAGCGKIVPLEPAPGHALPVKPAMAPRQLTGEELLQPRTDAAPSRVDELMRKSMPRRTDRFDLPPPDGGAPMLPAGTDPAAAPAGTTPADPPK